jgi:raffinose/stachyose/melibiose transport system permease protein
MKSSTHTEVLETARVSEQSGMNRAHKFLYKHGPAYLMLLLPVVFFATLAIYPVLWAIKYVFYYYDGYRSSFTGMTNFTRLIQDELYWASLWKQAIFALKILFELPLAFVLALILNSKIKGRNFFRAIFILPYIVPGATISLVFYVLLNPFNGEINRLLFTLDIIDQPILFLSDVKLAFLSGMLIDAWQHFGINMLFFLVGLNSISKEVYESADIDGVNAIQRIWYISLPMMGRILQIIVFLSLLGTLKSMGPFLVLTNGGPNFATEVTFLFIFHKFFGESGINFGYGATAAIVTAIFLLFLSVLYFKLSRRMDYH